MPAHVNYLHPPNKWKVLFIMALLLTGCRQKNTAPDNKLLKLLHFTDSLNLIGKGDSAEKLLLNARSNISGSTPLICDYYSFMAWHNAHINNVKMNLYADSALAFFNIGDRKTLYPDKYFKALILKGDLSIFNKQYNLALNYYYNAKKISSVGNCDDGFLVTKMAGIYYNQLNFKLAARYFAESVRLLDNCHDQYSFQKLFFVKQGQLNSTAISYEKAGDLDSARYYYLQDEKYIDTEARIHHFSNGFGNDARIVVYDNLGGLSIKQNQLDAAKNYLTKCINIPVIEKDGIKMPPFIKLAEVYIRTGELDKALNALQRSRALLNKYGKQNPESEVQWNKLYSEYLLKQGKPVDAYIYQDNYIRLKDSLENYSSDLYRLDIERELNTIGQKQVLIDLEQKDKVKQIYLAGIGVIVVLFVIIIILINGNLRRTQKNHKNATLYNEQLQHTLDELERVNQNYIRIMRVMAHDLRNPLSGITGIAALLVEEDEFSEDAKHMLKLIETTGVHSMEMINELLKSGLADENEAIQTQLIDLSALLFDSVELLQFKASDKQQQLVFEGDNTPIMVKVNHEKIWRVFNNLIVNAIKFSHPDSVIHVGIKPNKKHVLVSVADSGIGIPDKDKDNVFEMFTTAKKPGTNGEQPFGLGLSISKKIVEMHKGKIWFKSNKGAGTTFYIELPA
jgi:signal transduction histidine kinase